MQEMSYIHHLFQTVLIYSNLENGIKKQLQGIYEAGEDF